MHTYLKPGRTCLAVAIALAGSLYSPRACAQALAPADDVDSSAEQPSENDDEPKVLEAPKLPEPANAKLLSKNDRVWVDSKNRQVIVDGAISLREGYLEMFACTEGTKEHESIVYVQAHAATVHAALLAVGAVPGHPVRYRPKFQPASGTEIEVEVHWLDEQNKWQKAKAQDWIINVKTKKKMTQPWVFGGSGFWVDEKTGKKYYMAEAGDLICVSNFATAMMDIPIESSHENDALSFEANPEGIPPLGMPVRLILKPKLKDKETKETARAAP